MKKYIYDVVTKTNDGRQIAVCLGTDFKKAFDMFKFCKSLPLVKQVEIVSRETKGD